MITVRYTQSRREFIFWPQVSSVVLALLLLSCSASTSRQHTIDDFLEALEQAGLEVGQKQEKLFGLVLAHDGTGVDVNGEQIEVYQYDTTIKSGRDIVDTYAKEGVLGTRVLVHDNLMLLEEKKHPKWDEIAAVFRRL